MSWGCTHSHHRTKFLLLVLSRYIGDPNMIDHWPRPRPCADNGKLTRLHADDVKSQLRSHIAFPGSIYSLQVLLLLLTTQRPVRDPVKLLGGSPMEALQFDWFSGSTVCFPSRGSTVHIPGMHGPSKWNGDSHVSAVSVQHLF